MNAFYKKLVKDTVVEALADSIGEEAAAIIAAEAAGIVESIEAIELPWSTLDSRGRMYPSATWKTYETSVKERERDAGAIGVRRVCAEDDASCEECVSAASEAYVGLDEVVDIGDATCLTNCRCYYEFEASGEEGIVIDASFPLADEPLIG